ncbi:hypothetical protein GCM10010123_42060 [Pilimelia anulata]|uniref:Uncharacterized protein n=1 Tax=Pilimelia anulata TaxID=53371 RepID=A0A8J3BFX6_9ACTN|nr:hypothetical protein [Pilimelia anulata]GGK07671.1 hypothetical protein GCM10010123_42060 [Pilimelia anulata]
MRRHTSRLVGAIALVTAASLIAAPTPAFAAAPKAAATDPVPDFFVLEAGDEPDSGVPADWEDPEAVGPEGEVVPEELAEGFDPGDPDCKEQWVYRKKRRFNDNVGRGRPLPVALVQRWWLPRANSRHQR